MWSLERWAKIEELFHRAAECDPKERTGLLDEACGGDLELRRQVETLLNLEPGGVQAAIRAELGTFGFPLAGETISHYRIIDGVGAGGMGSVYRAEDIKLGRQVALKFLPEASLKQPGSLARFEREARSASALEHPNICPIYEFGENEGLPFLVMQLLEGQTLRELLDSRRLKPGGVKTEPRRKEQRNAGLPLEKVLDLAVQITTGLEAAHRKGIIHRDIKPANIFVTSQGEAKILDFGLAKAADFPTDEDLGKNSSTRVGSSAPETPDLFLSRTGVAVGTAGYMSPEQARGEKLDARTDLFSFGLVLYEMATGQRAFKGNTGPVLYETILNQAPTPARKLNRNLPARLEEIINRALEKKREARYQSIAELRSDLEKLKHRIKTRRARRLWAVASAVALLVITGTIFWFRKYASSASTTLPDLKLTQLTANSPEIQVQFFSLSPNGKFLAYIDDEGMHVKTVGTDDVRSLPLAQTPLKVNWELMYTAWFPDSEHFLANAHPATQVNSEWSAIGTSVWMFSLRGDAPRKLLDNALYWSVSPDGATIASTTSTGTTIDPGVWLMAPDGSHGRRLYETAESAALGSYSFLPDGMHISYVTNDGKGDSLVVRSAPSARPVTIFSSSESAKMGEGAFLPDGSYLYSDRCGSISRPDSPCNFWIQRRDLETGKPIEAPRRLTSWVGTSLSGPVVTSDGKRAAFARKSYRSVSYVTDLATSKARLVNSRRVTFEETGLDAVSDWTADSKKLIIVHNRSGQWRVYKQTLDGNEAQPVMPTTEAGGLEEAVLSPDQKWIIAQNDPPENTGDTRTSVRIMRVPMAGGSPELIFMTRNGSLISCPRSPSKQCVVAEESPDRKTMIVTAFDPVRGRGAELARFDLKPDANTGVKIDHLVLCQISPNGTRLAIARSSDGPIEIHSLKGQPTFTIRTPGLDKMLMLNWAADEKGLFVSRRLLDGSELIYVDFAGKTHSLWRSHAWCHSTPSPDGRHLAIYDVEKSTNIWMMENF